MFRAMWNAEMLKRKLEGASVNYSDELCDGRLLGRQFGHVCTCQWKGLWYSGGNKRRQLTRYRDILRDSYVASHQYRASHRTGGDWNVEQMNELKRVLLFLD